VHPESQRKELSGFLVYSQLVDLHDINELILQNDMKKMTMGVAIALTLMATMSTGCSNDNEKKPEPVICPVEPPTSLELTRAELQLVNSTNDFSFNLFRTAQDDTEEQPKSLILSPLSITFALGMLNNGASGETQRQINEVLGFGETGANSINAFCYKMLARASTLDPQTKVMTANTIYVNKPYELQADFTAKAKTYYDAEPESRDFHDGQTLDVINRWAADHTEQMIQEVLNKQTFSSNAVSYLLNAIYFKGVWATTFDKAQTVTEVFEHAGYTKDLTYCEMMHKADTLAYAENDSYQALNLPYGNGSFQMTVLLPKKKEGQSDCKLPEVPTAEAWQLLLGEMHDTGVDLKLPRIETSTDIDLKPIMQQLGMTDAFDDTKADFSHFCNTQTFIDLMKQVAKIKLDEEGTEAAAVTVIGMEKLIGPLKPRLTKFHADHPFIYIISEQQTGTIFFIGQYTGY